MKTLSFTVGLLLLITLYYCTAMPHKPNEVSPCCLKFFEKRIPKKEILSITKTHSRCPQKGFVFNTGRGQVCVSQTLDWAKKAFAQQHKITENPQ